MRILIAANDSDGLYFFRRDLIKRFIDDGHEVYVSLPDGDWTESLVEMGCHFIETPVDRRGINIKNDIKLLIKYFKIIKSVKPDLVITYTIKPNVYCGLAARLKRIPYAVNITGLGTALQGKGVLKEIAKLLYHIGCGKAKVAFTENPGNRDELCRMKLFKPEKMCVLHGAGVNTEHFAFEEYPPENEKTHFLFIGRIMQEKGIDEYFAAADKLLADGYDADFRIAGTYDEDEYRQQIEQRIKSDRFIYHGWLTDIRPAIKAAHCFVLPSWHEGMANTLLESAAMGRPLITSNIHGCMEAVNGEENGFLCEVRNADSLYAAMKRFADLPYAKKAEMGRASRDYICKVFEKKQVVEETVKHLY
ncbi:MAG: glycosyltransferase family 4 protein [Bacillota bacterium]|nr:glycosyltransferase family 4 protein [Bacillota bacterium]